ncbi:alpha/beta fold hydrolase [Salininema proteolyticum]|uniref:Alpha/beta fold hydrolase n=1 Tax=Salininema proteolyticum TaxID=1607685 RepID=A0ABV8TTE7_9ACTN
MASWKKKTAIAGAVLGGVAAGVATGVAVPKYLARRAKAAPDDPYAGEPFEMPPTDMIRSVKNRDGTSVHVETIGKEDAPVTVVFLHGYIQNSSTYYFQRQALARELADGLAVQGVFYDQPGHGLSGALPRIEYGIGDLAATLADVIEALAPAGRLVLVGHSMGGMAVQQFSADFPELWERVDGAVLLCTSASPLAGVDTKPMRTVQRVRRTVLPMMQRVSQWTPQLVERARRLVGDSVWLISRKQAFAEPHPSPSLVTLIERMNRETPIQTVVGYVRAILEFDGRSRLAAFKDRDVLVAAGDQDALTPLDRSKEIARALPDAQVAVVSARHNPQLERPWEISQKLLEIIYKSVEGDGESEPPAPEDLKRSHRRWWSPFATHRRRSPRRAEQTTEVKNSEADNDDS